MTFSSCSDVRTPTRHIFVTNSLCKKHGGAMVFDLTYSACGRFLKWSTCQSTAHPPLSFLVQIEWFTRWRKAEVRGNLWMVFSVHFPFLPHFSCVSLISLSLGKPAQHLPTPTLSRWVTPLLLAAPTFSQQLLQLQLNVYLGDCLLNACLFHLTICSMGAGTMCCLQPSPPRACHGGWHIVVANLLTELTKSNH